MTKENLLEVTNLNKKFYTKRGVVNAIDNVSFVVPKGKVVGLIGESGSGKTTVGRTLMNLHQADSGSIKFEGRELGGRRLTKNQKKDLYWNVQMIFQDPYSSLNGQKNIYSILQESLTAKKLHTEMLKTILKDRKNVLQYSKLDLEKKYWIAYYEYRNIANKHGLEILQKVANSVESFSVDLEKSISENFNRLKGDVFESKEIINFFVLNKSDELLNKILDSWTQAQKDYVDSNFAYKDEVELKKATENFEHQKALLTKTEEAINLKRDITKLEQELKQIVDDKKKLVRQTISNNKKAISNLKKEIKNYSNQKWISKTLEEQNLFDFLVAREKILLKSIKAAIKITKDKINNTLMTDIEFCREKIDTKFKEQLAINKFEKVNVEDAALFNELVTFLVNSHNNDTASFNEKMSQLTTKLNSNNAYLLQIKKPIIASKDQELFSKAKNELKIARTIFVNNTLSIEKTFKNEIDNLKQQFEEKNNQLTLQYDNLEKQVWKQFRAHLHLILKKCKKSNNLKSRFSEIKITKQIFRKLLLEDRELKSELRRNGFEIQILKSLLGFGKVKFNFIVKFLLRRSIVKHKIFMTLEEVGLNRSHAYRYPHEFSGGMRQRVGIARAIISQPRLIIADEPIAALDLSIQAQVVNLLLKLKKERNLSMIFIAHDLSMVEYNSDYVLIMHLGKIVEHGKTEKIFSRPVHPYTKNLLEAMPTLAKISEPLTDKRFEAIYRNEYSEFVIPKYYAVDEEHFVLATEEQFKTWKPLKLKK